MTFNFEYNKEKEACGKYFINIPFNLWEEFNQKGRIKAEVIINGVSYVSSLIPKGEGMYVAQLTKKMIEKSNLQNGQTVEAAINKIEKPEVTIQKGSKEYSSLNISFKEQPTSFSCGQACVAMLLDKPVQEIFDIVGKRPLGIGKMVELLNSFGVKNSQKNIRISKKNPKPSDVSVLTLKYEDQYHFVLHCKGKFYDPARGILDQIPANFSLSLYLEIHFDE